MHLQLYVLFVQKQLELLIVDTATAVQPSSIQLEVLETSWSVSAATATQPTTVHPELYDGKFAVLTDTAAAAVQPTTSSHQDVEPSSSSTKQQQPVTVKRKSLFSSPKTSKSKYTKVSDTHKQLSAMAQSKCVQIDEQLAISKARADREDKLHSLQVQKLELEISMLKEKDRLQKETEKREAAARELDMKIKEAQLKLIFKQLQEE